MREIDEELFEAIDNNDLSGVLKALSKGSNPNVKDKYGRTSLHLAAMKGNLDIIKRLISTGVDTNLLDKAGETFLHYLATLHSHMIPVLFKLFPDKIDPYKKSGNSWSIIHFIAGYQSQNLKGMIPFFLEHEKCLNALTSSKESFLHILASTNPDALIEILDSNSPAKNLADKLPLLAKNYDGYTILHKVAAYHPWKLEKLINILIKKFGFDKKKIINLQTKSDGGIVNIIGENSASDFLEYLPFLKNSGFNFSFTLENGKTVFHSLIGSSSPDPDVLKTVIPIMKENKISLNQRDDQDRTIIHTAIENCPDLVVDLIPVFLDFEEHFPKDLLKKPSFKKILCKYIDRMLDDALVKIKFLTGVLLEAKNFEQNSNLSVLFENIDVIVAKLEIAGIDKSISKKIEEYNSSKKLYSSILNETPQLFDLLQEF